MVEFNFSKVPCFQYKLLNIFRQTPLKYQKYYLRHLIVGIQTAFRLQKPYCKIFWCKHIEYESCKSSMWYSCDKKLVVSLSDVHFGFARPFLACRIEHGGKIAHPKNRALSKKFVQLWKRVYILDAIFNSFMTEVPIIQKRVHWFAEQLNGLVSIW